MDTLFIALGGAVGSAARYQLGEWLQRRTGGEFPWGTLAVNAIGSFVLAALMLVALRTNALSPTARLALGTGVLGGFTTYSTFNHETLEFIARGAWGTAGFYVVATLLGCFAAGTLGWLGARVLVAG